MIELDNKTNLKIDKQFLNKIAKTLTNKEIELIVTNNDEIQKINHQYRDINAPTDVLSFPYEDMPMAPLGSIVISFEYIKNTSADLGHSNQDELALLFIHGILHLLGYDHEIDNGEMREKEIKLIKEFNLPNSLIIRTQG